MKRTISFHSFTAAPNVPGPQKVEHEDDLLLEVPAALIPGALASLVQALERGNGTAAVVRFYAGKLCVGRKRAVYTGPFQKLKRKH